MKGDESLLKLLDLLTSKNKEVAGYNLYVDSLLLRSVDRSETYIDTYERVGLLKFNLFRSIYIFHDT